MMATQLNRVLLARIELHGFSGFCLLSKKQCLFKTSLKAEHKGLEIFIVSASFRSPRPVKFPGKHNTVFIIRSQMVTNKTECYCVNAAHVLLR